jgi:hypothetical protein
MASRGAVIRLPHRTVGVRLRPTAARPAGDQATQQQDRRHDRSAVTKILAGPALRLPHPGATKRRAAI